MLVVIANDLPPAVRGRMRLWFIESKPNVFVSGLKDSAALAVVDYLFEHCSSSSGLLIFRRINQAPWYEIRSIGEVTKQITTISGLQLIVEKSQNLL